MFFFFNFSSQPGKPQLKRCYKVNLNVNKIIMTTMIMPLLDAPWSKNHTQQYSSAPFWLIFSSSSSAAATSSKASHGKSSFLWMDKNNKRSIFMNKIFHFSLLPSRSLDEMKKVHYSRMMMKAAFKRMKWLDLVWLMLYEFSTNIFRCQK